MPEHSDEWYARQYDHIREIGAATRMLREAADRLKDSATAHTAAQRDVGAALRRADVAYESGREMLHPSNELTVVEAQELTGISRPTLRKYRDEFPPEADDANERDPRLLNNVALARMVVAYGYDDHRCSPELHRRYPYLRGLHDAVRAAMPPTPIEDLWKPMSEEQAAAEWDDPSNDGYKAVKAVYEAAVRAIAEGGLHEQRPL